MSRFGTLSDGQVRVFALELIDDMLNHIETSLCADTKLQIARDCFASLYENNDESDSDSSLLTDELLSTLPRIDWQDSAECRRQTHTPGCAIRPQICSLMIRRRQGAESEAEKGAESEAEKGAESEAEKGAESEAEKGAESEAEKGAESEAEKDSLPFLSAPQLPESIVKDADSCVCVQLCVLRQIEGGLCGYHALFNAIQLVSMMLARRLPRDFNVNDDDMLAALRMSIAMDECNGAPPPVFGGDVNWVRRRERNDDDDDVAAWQRVLASTLNWPTFWRFHEHAKRLLRERALLGGGDFYPWCLWAVDQSVLERPYCEFLLNGADFSGSFPAQLLGGARRFACYPELNVNCLKCGMVELAQLLQIHQRLDAFREQRDGQLAMVFGAGNHWITLVAEKSAGRTSLIHCDSLNNPTLALADDATLARLIDHYAEAHWGGFENAAKRAKFVRDYRRHMREIRFLVELVADCLIGARNLLEEGANYRIIGLLENFALACEQHALQKRQQQAASATAASSNGGEAHSSNANADAPPRDVDGEFDDVSSALHQSDVLLHSSESFEDISLSHVLHFCNEFSPPSMLRRDTLPFITDLRTFVRPRTIDRLRTWITTVRTVVNLNMHEPSARAAITEQEQLTLSTLLSLFDDIDQLFSK
jgi:hypothetical protein